MNPKAKKWLFFSLRWGIAVVGIYLVLAQISCHDRVAIINSNNQLELVRLWQKVDAGTEHAAQFVVYDPASSQGKAVPRSQTANKPDVKQIQLVDGAVVPLIGVDLVGDLSRKPEARRFYIIRDGKGEWITPGTLAQPYRVRVPYPRVDYGVLHMAANAKPWLLTLAAAIFPLTFVLTSLRWYQLLKPLEIYITFARAFTLNMVGFFYSTFMPGSTGGDVLKAYYASKQTTHRTRAVMSVFVDRVLGLLALVILGGAMAGYQWATPGPNDPAAHACGRIALISALILVGTIAGSTVLFLPGIRRMTGLDWVLSKLPKQKQIKVVMQTMDIYRRRPLLILWALLLTMPVHITVVFSAMLAGIAFGLKMEPLYYFVAVPVIVLAGAIPISPQGAGVMEYFAVLLIGRQGGTVSQAFALTMSIRMVQILWNLTGGVFVFRGGYHAPTQKEQQELTEDAPPENSPAAAT